ncbi:MAG: signal peptidase I [Flavobacteriaceae bacterium]|jgi:signal peptidase I|nr:signal peptidase I [Flavobacteriaceae bacterium]MBT5283254.1 signal peptidase I [Flavobacteriaceae bacterium]MBT5974809.1 signal peptidase I [Flavobacteriaceae bacterium]MBT6953862.1 signal peptidase I [Flavobacteriaceae bacterium]
MTLTQWILFTLAIQVIHFLGTWKLYKVAGYKSWQAAVPIYNAIILMKIIKRPLWWVILLFIPTINLILFGVIWVETLRSFGKNSAKDTFLGIITFGLYIYTINYSSNPTHFPDRSLQAKTGLGETVSSIMFAIVAATIVHNYLIQPYIIPTGSLEKSLLIGDFLFVSKFHYGARAPMTAVSFPMVHDTIPVIKTKSYLKKPQLPYFRLPALQKIKRNDIVVFSWPADTVRQFFVREKRVDKPIDKKSNYVKRCVGIPGDTLEIIDGFIHTNGIKNILPERAEVQYTFNAYAKKGVSSRKLLDEGFEDFDRIYKIENITESSFQQIIPYITGRRGTADNFYVYTGSKGLPTDLIRKLGLRVSETLEVDKQLTITLEEADKLRKITWIDSVKQRINSIKVPNESFFPNKIPYNWNEDNFGPLLIPKKEMSIELTRDNLPLYKKIIQEYEGNQLELTPTQIKINGEIASTYTFKKDYYWMMGDNRHKSEDSRFWGFVPDDHIVGKPVFIWFSIKGINDGIKNWSIRWDRVFTTVDGPGERRSYFPYFLVFVVLWQGYVFYRKRKAKA